MTIFACGSFQEALVQLCQDDLDNLKNEDNLDNLKNENNLDNLKNENNLKNEDDLSFWQWFWRPNWRWRVFVLFQLSTKQ